MGDEPVTDELLTEWESHASVGINTSATTSALIAEVRALRAQEGELRDAVEHQRGMYEREHNTVHELQRHIVMVQAVAVGLERIAGSIPAEDDDGTADVLRSVVADIRAALAGTEVADHG